MIQAVIFNLDGVIAASDACHFKAWQQMAHEQGLSFDERISRQMVGMKRMESLKILLKKAERSYSPGEMWALSARKNDLFNELVAQMSADAVLPGAVETARRLHQMGIRTAVASCSENARGILRQLKIDPLFDVIIDGGQISAGKPDPEVFLLAARHLQMPTSDCLVIENTLSGLAAAKAAGMKALAMGDAALEKGWDFHPENLLEMDLPTLIQTGRAEAIALQEE